MLFLGIWFLMVLIVSVLPLSGPKSDVPADKLAHFVIYGLTSIFVFRVIEHKTAGRRIFCLSVTIASLYGAAMEVLQHFLPHRSFSFGDMAANMIGALLVCLLYIKARKGIIDET